ncbi:MAG: hypothetical protein HWE22_20445 [Flavobacteriales bacterium]|nr:hypothetical protein [Flavobacteriales bacterium]
MRYKINKALYIRKFYLASLLSLVTIPAIFSSCSRSEKKIQQEIIGDWVVERVIYNGQIHERGFFDYNTLVIEKTGKCKVPMTDGSNDRDALWSVSMDKNNTDFFFEISESKNDLFNRTFTVDLIGEVDNLMKVHLISEGLEMHCSKVIWR